MISKIQILKQAIAELDYRSKELAALRRVKSRVKHRSKLIPGWPHITYIISGQIQKKNIRRISKGVRVLLFENSRTVGTLDFNLHKSKLQFSHFTFGNNAQRFYKQLKRIYKSYKIPDDTFLVLLKSVSLGKSYIQFNDHNKWKYFDIDSDSNMDLNEADLIKKHNAEWKKMQAGEKKFRQQKKQKKAQAIAHLNFLKYL